MKSCSSERQSTRCGLSLESRSIESISLLLYNSKKTYVHELTPYII